MPPSSRRSSCGTRAGTRSRCAISMPRRRATSCARCCAHWSRTASCPTRSSGTGRCGSRGVSTTRCSACSDRATRTIQPPFIGFAWELVAQASPDDPGFAGEAVGALAALHGWLERERDPDGSGLVALISPDESGLDASPKFDALMGWRGIGPARVRLAHPRAAPRGVPPRRRAAARRVLRAGGADDRGARGSRCTRSRGCRATTRTAPRRRASGGGAVRALLGRDAAACSSTSRTRRASRSASRPGRASRPWHCRTSRERWPGGSPSSSPTRGEYALPWPVPSTAASEPAFRRRTGPCPATGAARPGSPPPGCCTAACAPTASTTWRARSRARRRAWSPDAGCASTTTRSTARRRGPALRDVGAGARSRARGQLIWGGSVK